MRLWKPHADETYGLLLSRPCENFHHLVTTFPSIGTGPDFPPHTDISTVITVWGMKRVRGLLECLNMNQVEIKPEAYCFHAKRLLRHDAACPGPKGPFCEVCLLTLPIPSWPAMPRTSPLTCAPSLLFLLPCGRIQPNFFHDARTCHIWRETIVPGCSPPLRLPVREGSIP